MKKNILILLAVFAFFSFKSVAQEVTKGYMKYEVTEVKTEFDDDPNAEMIKNMLEGTVTRVYFDGPASITRMSMMGGMMDMRILVDKAQNTEMYIDAMGQKIVSKISKDEADKMRDETEAPKFVQHREKTKKIQGYDAFLVTMETDGTEGLPGMEYWVTDQIKTNAVISQGVDNDQIGGIPLEFSVVIPGQFSMTTTLTEFKNDFKSSVFEFDKSGYKEMSIEEISNMGLGGF